MKVQLDTDFLVWAVSHPGPERVRLLELSDSDTSLAMSAVAWYEFTRGPRTPVQVAQAEALLSVGGVIPFSKEIAEFSGELFRRLGAPRGRGNDVAIAATAVACEARLLTRNRRDFEFIPGLQFEGPQG